MYNFRDFSSREAFYQETKDKFDSALLKMWKVFWEKNLDIYENVDFENEIQTLAERYREKSLDKVWLNPNKIFEVEKMPEKRILLKSVSCKWWFGQIAGTRFVAKETQKEKDKFFRQLDEDGKKENCQKILNPHLEKITATVLELKQKSNRSILAAWFKYDEKKPILKELEKQFKVSLIRGYRESTEQNEEYDVFPKISSSKWSLLKINANFRFYYLWKKMIQNTISFCSEIQHEIFEMSYISICPEGKYHLPDRDVGKKLEKAASEVKEFRYESADYVLSVAKNENATNETIEAYLSKRVAERINRVAERDIKEGLSLKSSLNKRNSNV